MNNLKVRGCFLIVLFIGLLNASPAMGEEPLLTTVMLNELETADSSNNLISWDARFWRGSALNKVWLKTDGERTDGESETLEFQALYSKAISTYWDVQAGLRHEKKSGSENNWGVIGLQGLAPYFFEIDTALFIGDSGDMAFRFNSEYEILLTQRLILTPEIELNFYGQDNARTGLGSGLSDVAAELRLRYEIRRKITPYIGLSWHKEVGRTADYSRRNGDVTEETDFVIGMRGWF